METVAEENPLRSATSRMVTAESERRRGLAGFGAVLEDFGSVGPMDSLNFGLLLADTTGR
jgi:hypothetical protein